MNYDSELALARLREKLCLPAPHDEGFGEVHFHTDSGVVKIDNVHVDSIRAKNGIVEAEDSIGDVIHVPFVKYWTVHYRI